ncbi:MAG TPA: aldo/keto reductase [Burkholderiales bacterium]|nr:aldo/keto reductase [Burkholderiales bacterium]
MKYRRLGRNGPQVSAVGMGRGSQPIKFGDPLETEFNAAIRRAIGLGINFFDTSDAYWGGRHEELLGRALKGQRNQALIATKFGNIDLPDGKKGANGRPEYVFECCDASLRRLGVETIDLYYLHRVDPGVPIEETVGAMAQLVSRGKVRFLGICEAGARTLRRAHREHPIVALQTEYSLWFRDVEHDILPACRELGVGYVAYAPLGRGLLTGAIKSVDDLPPGDRRRRHPRFLPENLARNVGLVQKLETIAARNRATAAQVALAWILAQGEDVVPIPGTNHVHNLEQNVAAVELQLTTEELEELNRTFAIGAGAGERYPVHVLKGVGL